MSGRGGNSFFGKDGGNNWGSARSTRMLGEDAAGEKVDSVDDKSIGHRSNLPTLKQLILVERY